MVPARSRDGALNVMVESPRGASVKFRYDPTLDRIAVTRPLPSGLVYPHDWGCVPSTRAPDGDPLDAMIAWEATTYPGVIVPSRAIGVLQVEQTNLSSRRRERNDRLIVLPLKAPRQQDVETVFQLPDRWRAEIERFFAAAVAFEGKELTILGWGGPVEADALVSTCVRAREREDEARRGMATAAARSDERR